MPTDPAELSSLPMPDDTVAELVSSKTKGGDSKPAAGSPSAPEPSKPLTPAESAAMDITVAKLAVERGLCTQEELDFCIQKNSERRHAAKSLCQLLMESESITKRQLLRLQQAAGAGKTGEKIPGYAMLGKLGEGATATVFKARQTSLNRMVAVKVLPRRFSSNPKFVEQLYFEGRVAASLNHPNIVQAYDVGSHGEFHYFVMEYIEGKTVHDLILEKKRFEEEESLDILIPVARALAHAHEKGLIHRDVKPKNIMLTPQGVTKLADLGLARVTTDPKIAQAEKGKPLGTPYYMSPEQVRGDEVIGPAADIYALGATWYFMITGETAFKGRDSEDIMRRHVEEPVTPPITIRPDITPGVSEMIVKMMAKDPAARYGSAEELAVELEAWKTYHEMKRMEQGSNG